MMMNDLKTLKIGYAPLSPDFSEPGDRRRFCSYANARGLTYQKALPDQWYDLVYLTYNCDIPAWINYKKKHGQSTRLIFELVDSYLFENNSLKAYLRGIGNYMTGKSSRLYVNYKKAIIKICNLADAVICSTLEQQAFLHHFNSNVHLSLDVFDEEVSIRKNEYKVGSIIKLVWEGQPYTMDNILSISPVLNRLRDQIELHVVSDNHYYSFSKHYLKRNTLTILKGLKCPVIFHPWQKESFTRHICEADLAIIPINLENRQAMSKPENKLILLWRMGIPVLTSPTPAYRRVMELVGLDMMCQSCSDWLEKIEGFKQMSTDDRQGIGDQTMNFSRSVYHQDKMFQQWDQIMTSVVSDYQSHFSR